MKLLLDTCTLLWVSEGSSRLSEHCRTLFADPDHEVMLSVVSTWEILVHHGLGRITLPDRPELFLRSVAERYYVQILPLALEAVLQLPKLPKLHRDPFDRMLICQAIAHGMTIVTPDPVIHRYPVAATW